MNDRTDIHAAKAALPLPRLFAVLGIETSANGQPRRNPLRDDDQNMSFSCFEIDGQWGWKDHATDAGGDEITFLEAYENLSKGDAIRRFTDLAGIHPQEAPQEARVKPSPVKPKDAPAPLDWQASTRLPSEDEIRRLAAWRSYTPKLITWAAAEGILAIHREGGQVCFPIHDEAGTLRRLHVTLWPEERAKPKRDGSPRAPFFYYPAKGCPIAPMIIGKQSARRLFAFESQWDALAWIDHAGGLEDAPCLVTRGASNGKFAGLPQVPPAADLVAIMQGDAPAEKWLAAVTSAFPGNVHRLDMPEGIADFNDWLKAGNAPPLATLLEAAKPVGKDSPCEVLPRNHPLPGDHPRQDEVQPVTTEQLDDILERAGLWWLDGTDKFLHPGDNGKRYVEKSVGAIARTLRVQGIPRKAPEGESVSLLDRLLVRTQETRIADWAGTVAGYHPGPQWQFGKRIIIKAGPKLIEPRPGDWSTIWGMLDALLADPVLGDIQIETLCAWLKLAWESLASGNLRSGQCLVLAGRRDIGKGRLQNWLVTPILGGRTADPGSYFAGTTDFNSELIGAEHLICDDPTSGLDPRSRERFGEQVKRVVAADVHRAHKKTAEALTLKPFWRVTVSINENPDRLRVLPPLSSDLRDKFILLKCHARPLPMPADSTAERAAFEKAIADELPCFLHHLSNWEIPEEMGGGRFGVRHFHHPELLGTLLEGEPEEELLYHIDGRLFLLDAEWEGATAELLETLTNESYHLAFECRKLFKDSTALGRMLGRLADRYPDRFERKRVAGKGNSAWLIRRYRVA